jgi:hypothetical protein
MKPPMTGKYHRKPKWWKEFLGLPKVIKGLLGILAAVAAAVLTPYISKQIQKWSENAIVLSGSVYEKKENLSLPVYSARVKILQRDFEDRTDSLGNFHGRITGSGIDSVTIEITLSDNRVYSHRIELNFNQKQKQLGRIEFQERATQKKENTERTTTTIIPNSGPSPINYALYYDTQAHVDIAILLTGNGNTSNLGETIREYFQTKQKSVSTSFFHGAFRIKYANDLLNDNISILNRLGLNQNIQYICLVNQTISFQQNKLTDEPFITASGKYDIKIIHLINKDIVSFSINANGSGVTQSAAQESLEEHFTNSFFKKISNYQL